MVNPSLCFIIQATGRYYDLAVDLINSIEPFLCPQNKRKVVLFTDRMQPQETNFHNVSISTLPPPDARKDICLYIFDYILSGRNVISQYDFAYKIDADMLISDLINPEEITANTFMGVQHFNNKTQHDHNYMPQTCSAYIPEGKRNTPAWQSCFFGGRTKDFLEMSEKLSEIIKNDVKNNFQWGAWEEPYLNWYFNKHVNEVSTVPPNFATPLHWYKFPPYFRERYKEMSMGMTPKAYHFNITAWNHTK